MSVRLRNVLVLLAALAVAVAAATFIYRFTGRPPDEAQPLLPFQQGGIKVSLVPDSGVGGPAVAEAAAGDWLFESDRVRLLVGGYGDGAPRRFRYGSIVDLVMRDFADEKLVEFRPVLQVSGKLVGTRVDGVRLESGGPRPVLRLLQASRDGSISLETELRLVPGQPFVELVSHVKNLGGALLRSVQVGERARWRGPASFAPRLGFVRAAMHAEVPRCPANGSARSASPIRCTWTPIATAYSAASASHRLDHDAGSERRALNY